MNFNIEEGRYIILGSVDGLLATLGIIIGVSIGNVKNSIVVGAALGGAIALAMTNSLGAYLAESAVEYGKLTVTEKSLLRKLENTYVESLTRKKIMRDSAAHGVSSFIGSLVPISPYLLSTGSPIMSIVLSLIALALLGFYSGFISKRNYIVSIIKMVGLGMIVVIMVNVLKLGR